MLLCVSLVYLFMDLHNLSIETDYFIYFQFSFCCVLLYHYFLTSFEILRNLRLGHFLLRIRILLSQTSHIFLQKILVNQI